MPNITAVTMGQFARELCLQLEPLEDLLASWNLTSEQYEALRKSTFFQNELKAAVKEVREMGPDAGFIARAKILSETFLTDVVKMMQTPGVDPAVKIAIFKHITELARLTPPRNSPDRAQGPVGPQVVFQFGPGMPGVPNAITINQEPAEPVLEDKSK